MCRVLYRILWEKRCIHSEIEDTFLFRRCSQIFERTSVVGINSMRERVIHAQRRDEGFAGKMKPRYSMMVLEGGLNRSRDSFTTVILDLSLIHI